MTTYHGVKFKTEIINNKIPQNPLLKELKYWCKRFHHYNLAPPYEGGSFGNLSFRLKNDENVFIITGSKIGLKNTLSNSCFAKVSSVDLEKAVVYAEGRKKPSSESILHFAIYRQRKDVNAVFHGHCQKILDNVNRLGIAETEKEEPYGTIELVKRVLEIIDKGNFLVMKNHGFISLGKTMKEAGELSIKMHKKCQ